MRIVRLLNSPGSSDPGRSMADPIESSGRYTPYGSAQRAAVLRPVLIHNSIFREPDGRLNRPLIGALTVAGLLTIGHFVCPASSGTRIWFDGVAKMAQVILPPESPRQGMPRQRMPRQRMPRGIAPAAPTSNPEYKLGDHQA